MVTREIITSSAAETQEVARNFAATLSGGETILFYGDLGSGKTTFIRGLAQGLGIDPREVSSPSYTLINIYEGEIRLIHADLYRLASLEEIEDLALLEELNHTTVLAIEWSERLSGDLLTPAYEIHLEYVDEDQRRIVIQQMI